MEHYIKFKELAGYIAEFRDTYELETLDDLYNYLKENKDMRITIER